MPRNSVLSHRYDLSGVATFRDDVYTQSVAAEEEKEKAGGKRRRASSPTQERKRPRWDDVQQLRHLRLSAVEQALRAVRQLWDTTSVGSAAVAKAAVSDQLSHDERQTPEFKRSQASRTLRQVEKDLWSLARAEITDEDKKAVRSLCKSLRAVQALPAHSLWPAADGGVPPCVDRVMKTLPPAFMGGSEAATLLETFRSRMHDAQAMTAAIRAAATQPATGDSFGGVEAARARSDFSDIVAPHVDSFNWASGQGLKELVKELKGGKNLERSLELPLTYAVTATNVGRKATCDARACRSKVEACLASLDCLADVQTEGDETVLDWQWCGPCDGTPQHWLLGLRPAPESLFVDGTAQSTLSKYLNAREFEIRAALDTALAGCGWRPKLWKVVLKSGVERAEIGWDVDDGPLTTPAGRLSVQRVFRRWAGDHHLLGGPGDKPALTAATERCLHWIKTAAEHGTEGGKDWCPQGVQDPGLPIGGREGLRSIYEAMAQAPGSTLHPQTCRLNKRTYNRPLFVKVSFGYAFGPHLSHRAGPTVSDWFLVGWVPVMLRSDLCVLKGADREKTAKVFREEEREPGGYFVIQGNERALRLLMVARGNYPLTVERESFENKSGAHTDRCLMLRSVTPSGLYAPNFMYALSSGGVALSFNRGRILDVSVMSVLMALNEDLTPLELAQMMRTGSARSEQGAAAFLQEMQRLQAVGRKQTKDGFAKKARKGFPSSVRDWQELFGRVMAQKNRIIRQKMRTLPLGSPVGEALGGAALPSSESVSAEAEGELQRAHYEAQHYRLLGLWVLREHVLPHLNDPEVPFELAVEERRRKMQFLIVCLRKLFAFIGASDGKEMMDGEDRIMNQEAFTAGQTWLHCVGDGLMICGERCDRHLRATTLHAPDLWGIGPGGPKETGNSPGSKKPTERRKYGVDPDWSVLKHFYMTARGLAASSKDAKRAALEAKLRQLMFKSFWLDAGAPKEPREHDDSDEESEEMSLDSEQEDTDTSPYMKWRPRYDDPLPAVPTLGLIRDRAKERRSRGAGGKSNMILDEDPCEAVNVMVNIGCYGGKRGVRESIATMSHLEQNSGWSVTVERIGIFRFLENFRATHRGEVVANMRSTEPRRYQMDGWGFSCIVHTPDGGLCGVLNHLPHQTLVAKRLPPKPTGGGRDTSHSQLRKRVLQILRGREGYSWYGEFREGLQGLRAMAHGTNLWIFSMGKDRWKKTGGERYFPVTLDGEFLGALPQSALKCSQRCDVPACALGDHLRRARCPGGALAAWPELETVDVDPAWVESVGAQLGVTRDLDLSIDPTEAPRVSPGLHMFASGGRLMRPIRFAGASESDGIVNVGSLEQIFLDIAALHRDLGDQNKAIRDGASLPRFRFVESSTTSALSVTASLIPFFEMNCSPRNLFQCGMAKQTMGSCFHSLAARNDVKLYHNLHTSAALLRTQNQHRYRMDDYPNGHNVVLAVAAYTGFDMEDALIINQTSLERGMFGGAVYFSHVYDARLYGSEHWTKIPKVADTLSRGDRVVESAEGSAKWPPKGHPELKRASGRVHDVTVLRMDGDKPQSVRLVFRVNRIPTVGDKFASRHGQKGTVPLFVPQCDMPFSPDGVVPDVIINPHAFPSRMTVGMLLEMITAKFGAVDGSYPDATAWSEVSEEPIHATRIGDLLAQHGYCRSGSQLLTNGMTGEQIQAEIFIGICYYQRLRHMVDDKFQGREAGAAQVVIDPLTGQPIKGRKKGGGVKIGEMERDAILAHGGRAIGEDRMLRSADIGIQVLCANCGSSPCSCTVTDSRHRWGPQVTDFLLYQFRNMGIMYRHLPRDRAQPNEQR
eukprot:TRINITY_DN32328_c0_g1_i1.p1 TRINITY_DN32328_c0_g1~~TRINITY_DN32328_c0_g1_i1.p1  ORF type:complete len:1817 (+),score=535.42 TRINITY_DN32328_c0_g1_i1:68-5518(+)